ncbi:MAG: DUF2961 domain-containing protein [Phycisphaerales bacterium]|nr:DUF2961 domain-containing protein [Phycisphaerales bacterium]
MLREMVDREALARFPDPPYTCRQFSSYDRASVSPDQPETWFANGDVNQYLRVEEAKGAGGKVRKEWVMADMAGPGAVVRIWSANPKGVMRVYLDGEARPVIEAPMQEVLGGKWKAGDVEVGPPLAQESSRGWNLYLPIPYAKHCKITSDADGFYYQVNYRTYGPQVQVWPLQIPDPDASARLKECTDALLLPREPEISKPHDNLPLLEAIVEAGASVELRLPPGPGAVSTLLMRLGTSDADVLRKLRISAKFDGKVTVSSPVGDFFGCGPGFAALEDRYRRVELPSDGQLTSYWIMPYERDAVVRVNNLGTRATSITLIARTGHYRWDSRSMHFHAAWRGEYPIHALGARGTMDWNYIDIQGKGVYVGDNLAVMNPVPEWWGEGDEKIYIDGETFPSHFGTGTEDYYGYAWCWPVVFQHPFHAQPRCDGNGKNNWGHTSVTRVRALDAIPFEKSLKFDMEVWHWKECDVAYAATTYWYALPGSTSNRLSDEAIAAMTAELKKPIPQPPPLPPPFKIEGAIECEGMQVLAKSDGLPVVPQDMDGYGKKAWSGDSHLWVQGRRVGDFVEVAIPAGDGPEARAARRVTLYATRSWDYGIVRFTVNGKPAGPAEGIDLYSGGRGKVVATGPIELGTFTPVDGRLVLRAEVIGGNAKSEGSRSFFGLDAVVLSPEK